MLYDIKALQEKLAEAQISQHSSTLQSRLNEIRANSAYGAARAQQQDEQCSTCSDDAAEADGPDDAAEADGPGENKRTPRTTHEERRRHLLENSVLFNSLDPRHKCQCKFDSDNGMERSCTWNLYGDGLIREQVETFRAARNNFLLRASAHRREAAYDNMRVAATTCADSKPQVEYLINGRLVCRRPFLERFPLSKSTLQRLERRLVANVGPHGVGLQRERATSEKRLQVIAWWLSYANVTAERMPDVPYLFTPSRQLTEIYAEYAADLSGAGRGELKVHPSTFSQIYRNATELDHITISKGKRNFTRCSTCVDLDARLQVALKSHDAKAIVAVKAERVAHHATMRADRLAYYARREEARKTNAVLTMIIDKMDQAKNLVPCFTRRWPKDAEAWAQKCLTLHVAGVIIHGTPDKRYLFPASQQLAGNANLNLECIRRAFLKHLEGGRFRDEMHMQFDNAKGAPFRPATSVPHRNVFVSISHLCSEQTTNASSSLVCWVIWF